MASNLVENGGYKFRVIAYNRFGESQPSDPTNQITARCRAGTIFASIAVIEHLFNNENRLRSIWMNEIVNICGPLLPWQNVEPTHQDKIEMESLNIGILNIWRCT